MNWITSSIITSKVFSIFDYAVLSLKHQLITNRSCYASSRHTSFG